MGCHNLHIMNVVAVIPSRYASSRFPGKPLATIGGMSMLERVYRQASTVNLLKEVIVATDDQRIFQHVESFGGTVRMTSDQHLSGTDRCAEIAEQLTDVDCIINIQGDEPFLQPRQIELLITQLEQLKGQGVATLAKLITEEADLFNPSVVKVTMTKNQRALYFSRNVIPYCRGVKDENYLKSCNFYKHIGIYGFYRSTLLALSKLPPSQLELAESLEQLRWLENGYPIQVGLTDMETIGIDTPADLEMAEEWLKNRK